VKYRSRRRIDFAQHGGVVASLAKALLDPADSGEQSDNAHELVIT
jgi:hypothetical protein